MLLEITIGPANPIQLELIAAIVKSAMEQAIVFTFVWEMETKQVANVYQIFV
ncbi:unnamed protein product [marine sediment metagenome]|uniref:Uncharacterized protein n=1 Tax=marine sediment metagenome TaxID=412755 RepID=X1HXG4_9ZZZZ